MKFKNFGILSFALICTVLSCCSRSGNGGTTPTPPTPTPTNEVDFWLTKGDQTVKLQKQSSVISFNSQVNSYPNIEVDVNQKFQTIDGFGYTLTGGSVDNLNRLSTSSRQSLLNELFGNSDSSIGVSFLRISIGASDLNSETFSYDDVASGQTDLNLTQFSLSKDQALISTLKDILAINPNIKIIATPWSAPVWMKDNGSFVGGSLKPEYYDVYSKYFVKYIQAMKTNGINITAITPQNEPLFGGNNPSMVMSATEQATFIKNNLGPAFRNAGISTKIVVYDHNCDRPDYPISILSDTDANQYVDGSAFHLYGGDIAVLSGIHSTFPTKNLYFTEQWTSSTGDFSGDLNWHLKNVIIGSMKNWSNVALEWNLANDANFQPHTTGGCTQCKGAITVNGSDNFTRNVAYYIIAHASKFVPQNSVRVSSTQVSNLNNVAFVTPSGKTVLIVENEGSSASLFNIKMNGKWAMVSLDAQSVGTYIF